MMRLVCPNCDAVYEVEASLIPEAGRDVQCSNCGHAWYQPSPVAQAEAEAEKALFAPAAGLGPEGADLDGDDPEGDDDYAPPSPPRKDDVAAARPKDARSIDASVLSVLREEAARESQARQAEAGSLEVQDELGLRGQATPAAERIARMKGEAEEYTVAQAVAEAAEPRNGPAKSEILPEIDAINSTLRAKSERRTGGSAVVADTMLAEPPGGSFWRGFLVAMLMIILVLGLYMLAPLLIEKVPALASLLRAYMTYVEMMRGLLDAGAQAATAQIRSMIGGV
jgi:predicted Zn finger-like uncharacterized protein